MRWPHMQGQTPPEKSEDQKEGETTDEPDRREEVSARDVAHKEWCHRCKQVLKLGEKERENVFGGEH